MPLTDDEYTCLLIMKDGENLIRMHNTRWYGPLGALHERDLIKPIGNENFVINQNGAHALMEHQSGINGLARRLVMEQGGIQANRKAMHTQMGVAITALSAAAEIAAKTTGQTKRDALRNIAHEVLERALEKIA